MEVSVSVKIDLHMMDRVQQHAKYSCKTAFFHRVEPNTKM